MCWQDIMIARRTKVTASFANIASDKVYQYVPYNKYRYSLLLATNGSDPVTWSFDKNMLGGIGQNLFPSYPAVMLLNLRDHGAMVLGPIWARSNALAVVLPYYESVLEESAWEEIQQWYNKHGV